MRYFCALFLLVLGGSLQAQESGFLSDYSALRPASDDPAADLIYEAPDAETKVGKYLSVMIDQPEIFISPNSKYKGLKPSQMGLIAEAFRQELAQQIANDYRIVDAPGKDVMYIRTAFSDVYVRKPKRGILSYVPVGAVIHGAKGRNKEVFEKMVLIGGVVELEIMDSQSGEVLVQIVTRRGAHDRKADEPMEWDGILDLFEEFGKRTTCHLNNVHFDASHGKVCL